MKIDLEKLAVQFHRTYGRRRIESASIDEIRAAMEFAMCAVVTEMTKDIKALREELNRIRKHNDRPHSTTAP